MTASGSLGRAIRRPLEGIAKPRAIPLWRLAVMSAASAVSERDEPCVAMRRASVGDAQAHGPAGLKINSYVRTSSQILTDDYTVYEDIVSYLKSKEEWSTSTPTGKTARAVAQRQFPHAGVYAGTWSLSKSSAMSTSMSSCPPTRPRRPASTRSVRASTSKRSATVSAWRRKLEYTPA